MKKHGNICLDCGAWLDPGERCDCQEAARELAQTLMQSPLRRSGDLPPLESTGFADGSPSPQAGTGALKSLSNRDLLRLDAFAKTLATDRQAAEQAAGA